MELQNITGHKGLFQKDQIQIRQLRDDVTLEQIQQATKDNNLDEIVLKTNRGNFILYADELRIAGQKTLPKSDSSVKSIVDFGDIRGEVLFSDDEVNEAKIFGGAFSVAGAAGGALGGFGIVKGVQALATKFPNIPAMPWLKFVPAAIAVTGAIAAPFIGQATKSYQENDALIRALAK